MQLSWEGRGVSLHLVWESFWLLLLLGESREVIVGILRSGAPFLRVECASPTVQLQLVRALSTEGEAQNDKILKAGTACVS